MALSDSWSNIKFSLWFTSIHRANWKENVAIYQKSLSALFQAPLQMKATNGFATSFVIQPPLFLETYQGFDPKSAWQPD